MSKATQLQMDKCASAKSHNLSISTKHSVEISRQLRFRSVAYAKKFLEDVLAMNKAVPFKRYRRDVGHKRGRLAAGRFPLKAAAQFLRVIKGVEANAQAKGLNSASLKIVKLVANKASIPFTGGRQRHATKRTHIEVVVQEMKSASKVAKKPTKKAVKKQAAPKVENKEVKSEAAKATPVQEVAKKEKKEEAQPVQETTQEAAQDVTPEAPKTAPTQEKSKPEVTQEQPVKETKPEVKKEEAQVKQEAAPSESTDEKIAQMVEATKKHETGEDKGPSAADILESADGATQKSQSQEANKE